MYFQPYGDDQQLNLNWIINEIINLHKQLDPDYETPSFTQVYPYSNLNRLNLDWVLSELKALKELTPEPTPEIDIQAVAVALVALPFDSNTSYQIYDFISKDGEIWRATEAIAAGEVWDETKWFKTKIGTDLAVLERWINAINNSLTSLQNTVADLSSIDISDDSDAGGATVKASLNLLKGSLNSILPFDTSPQSGSAKGVTSGGLLSYLDNLYKLKKLYRFYIPSGTQIAANDEPAILKSWTYDDTVLVENGKIHITGSGFALIFCHVIGSCTNNRLWYRLFGVNTDNQHISYGAYCTGEMFAITQYTPGADDYLWLHFYEPLLVGGGNTGAILIYVMLL